MNKFEQTQQSLDFFGSQHSPYYIGTPHFTQKSAGPRALHYLCHALNELGYEAYVTPCQTNPRLRTPLLTADVIQKHKSSGRISVAVYPEVARGNPLQQAVIARWLLNKAGHLAGHKDFNPDELIFYWEEWVLDGETGAERLFTPIIDDKIFNAENTGDKARTGFCYYANKYLKFGGKISEKIIQNGISLCHNTLWTTEEIATILKTSKVLYCYEPSALMLEAAACGCQVIYISTDYSRQFNVNSAFVMPSIPEDDIDFSYTPTLDLALVNEYLENMKKESLNTINNFIQKTQQAALDYSEKSKEPIQMLNRGIAAFQADDFGEAMAVFSDLLNIEPENPLPPAYLAFICARQGLTQKAIDFIEKSSQLAPNRADLRAALGETFLKAGRPDLAAEFLNEAISAQPDLFAAYPALAQSLHLTGQTETAVSLLQPVANMPSQAQSNIQSTLLEILEQRGDLTEFTRACLRFSHGMVDNLLAVRCLSCFDFDGEHLLDALSKIQAELADAGIGNDVGDEDNKSIAMNLSKPLKIAFLVSHFAQEQHRGRLLALLRYLPSELFVTLLLINDRQCAHNDYFNTCSLLADQNLLIFDGSDALALEAIQAAAPDILIDLDAYDPLERLSVFLQAEVPYKLLWGEAPMPPLSPDCKVLAGLRVGAEAQLPCVTLPETGEYYEFPELPIPLPTIAKTNRPVFGCLTPAARISRDGWRLFAEVLDLHPDSQLLINLKDLGRAAQDFIRGEFARAGIAALRLRFVHAHRAEDLCKLWQEIDLGLAPPVDTGDLALPSCLWMGKPYLALSSPLPWGRRSVALLETVGAEEWIAETPEAYLELSRQTLPAPNPQFRARMLAAGMNDPAVFAQGFANSILNMLHDATPASF
ncbi:hypothetical protein FACS1894185_4050 [Betaproteobacteria bacterium]|nr:hypothetical protein FACS1894185_4050 [Betaproteobacteria bacterium]